LPGSLRCQTLPKLHLLAVPRGTCPEKERSIRTAPRRVRGVDAAAGADGRQRCSQLAAAFLLRAQAAQSSTRTGGRIKLKSVITVMHTAGASMAAATLRASAQTTAFRVDGSAAARRNTRCPALWAIHTPAILLRYGCMAARTGCCCVQESGT
jgi:hypothetical protein